jgi:hypothetical protein
MEGGFVYILANASGVLDTVVTRSLDGRIIKHCFDKGSSCLLAGARQRGRDAKNQENAELPHRRDRHRMPL